MGRSIVDKVRQQLNAAEPGAVSVMHEYANDPVRFAIEILGMIPWSRQIDVLCAIAEFNRVAVRSGHKIGKSTIAAIIGLWWVATRAHARVIFVAPTARQIRSITFREVRRAHRNAVGRIGGELHETPDRGLQFPDGRELTGVSTDSPERIAGFSGPAMLFVVDEASGVSEELFAAIAGNLAGGGKLLLLGNPTRPSGTFFECWNRKSSFYKTLHISSLETPNASGTGDPIPGLATKAWIDEMISEWGADSPLAQVRIFGEYPSQSANAIIGIDLLQTSVQAWREAAKSGPAFEQLGILEIGLDPARMGGDESVAIVRRGNVALMPVCWRNLDGVQLAARVMELVSDHRRFNETPVIRVDIIGIGSSVFDQLRLNRTVRTVGINVSESPVNVTYARKRDECWFVLKQFIKDGGCVPPDPKLEAELVAAEYSFTPGGKIQVESKDLMRARLKRSPDRADALGLAVYTSFSSPIIFGEYAPLPSRRL